MCINQTTPPTRKPVSCHKINKSSPRDPAPSQQTMNACRQIQQFWVSDTIFIYWLLFVGEEETQKQQEKGNAYSHCVAKHTDKDEVHSLVSMW